MEDFKIGDEIKILECSAKSVVGKIAVIIRIDDSCSIPYLVQTNMGTFWCEQVEFNNPSL